MEACVVICRTHKPAGRRGKVLFIDAVREVARERSLSFLTTEHQGRIVKAYRAFMDEPGFAGVATTEEILNKEANLSIPRYVRRTTELADNDGNGDFPSTWITFDGNGREFWLQMDAVVDMLEGAVAEKGMDA
jgi:type I restriction enzyme M protein